MKESGRPAARSIRTEVWGILTYVLLNAAVGRLRRIPLALWMVAVGCAAVLVADYL